MFHWCFKNVSRVFHGCLMGVSMVFQNVLDVVLDVVFYGVAVV